MMNCSSSDLMNSNLKTLGPCLYIVCGLAMIYFPFVFGRANATLGTSTLQPCRTRGMAERGNGR